MPYSAAIMAGGFSRRFGQDKALFSYQGKAMLEWVASSFEGLEDVFMVTNRVYPDFSLNSYQDIIKQQGPLSGIHAALNYAKHDWVAIAACDMPFLTPKYWQTLAQFQTNQHVIMLTQKAKLEPLAAFYHKACLPVLEQQLQQGKRAIHELIPKLNAQIIPFEILNLAQDSLKNINYLEDIAS